MIKNWITPAGEIYIPYADMLKQSHLLIAGASGSGKSTLINGLIYSALYAPPNEKQLILIDPKRVELNQYKQLPHTLKHATETPDIINTLYQSINIMENRYLIMQERGDKQYTGSNIYIIVDEFADLMTTAKKETIPLLCRLSQLGRAANIHLILATQRPTKDIITGQIKVNLISRIALHVATPQDSRNIIDIKGAEKLPLYGYGIYNTPQGTQVIKIIKTEDNEITRIINHWTQQNINKWRLFK